MSFNSEESFKEPPNKFQINIKRDPIEEKESFEDVISEDVLYKL